MFICVRCACKDLKLKVSVFFLPSLFIKAESLTEQCLYSLAI